MSNLSKELVLIVHQFLREEKYKGTMHKLEEETGLFFNLQFIEEKILAGEWDQAEKYMFGFTKVEDNRFSMKMFFEIRKQKYLEALDRNDNAKAIEILRNDLKVFSVFNEDIYREITLLLNLGNFREHEQLAMYVDAASARSILILELKRLAELNPMLKDKLNFPLIRASRLQSLLNQSLNWQHHLCRKPNINPEINSLITDHSCQSSSGTSSSVPLGLSLGPSQATPIPKIGGNGAFQPTAAATRTSSLANWIKSQTASPSVQSAAVVGSSASGQPCPVHDLGAVPAQKRPRTSSDVPALPVNQGNDDNGENLPNSSRPSVNIRNNFQTSSWSVDDLPTTVVFFAQLTSNATSFDFHPVHHTLLLVGSSNAEVTLWDVGLSDRLTLKPFKIWNLQACSLTFQDAIAKDSSIGVSRVTWSPDGSFIGVAFNKHLIHVYDYRELSLYENLEIDAHRGSVNDLQFSNRDNQLTIVTCADDGLVKVWDLSGRMLFKFVGHQAAVLSVCPHEKDNIHFIFSTSIDGKIKAWAYNQPDSVVDYDAPGNGRTRMLYSTDGSRLFSCGTSRLGEISLVEWNEIQGVIKTTFSGFINRYSAGNVHFDTSKNHYVAVGEDRSIKFWQMNDTNILFSVDADGGLTLLPRIKFNKDGNFLAVNTTNYGLKVLATPEGRQYLKANDRCIEVSPTPNKACAMKVPGSTSSANSQAGLGRPTETDANVEADIVDPDMCKVIDLPNGEGSWKKVSQLCYTNYGTGIVAIGTNGLQKLWKWGSTENQNDQATARILPYQWQPSSGALMKNKVPPARSDAEPISCIAISDNDAYVMSASGGTVSLFNILNFKMLVKFLPPPPVPTFLAFYPNDNNIIAAGMEDSMVYIYNVRFVEIIRKWKAHTKHITGLAFSTTLNILVTSGSDAQVCTWSSETWAKRSAMQLFELPVGSTCSGDTHIQFHSDQIHLLIVHETQLAIYNAERMECINRWVPQDQLAAPISNAVYSCDSQLVYTSFRDGYIGVFDAQSMTPKCRIAPSAYNPQNLPNSNNPVYPFAITAHPLQRNQMAIGLTNGIVKLIQPLESVGKWVADTHPSEEAGTSGNAAPTPEPSAATPMDEAAETATPAPMRFVPLPGPESA